MSDSKSNKILIVDEDVTITKALERQLHNKYTVLIANNSTEALNMVQKQEIQVVLSDPHLPLLSGMDFSTKLSKDFPEIVQIGFINLSEINSVIKAVNKTPIYRYVIKPIEKADLEISLAESFEKYASVKVERTEIEALRKDSEMLNNLVVESTRRLEMSELHLRTILDSSPDCIKLIDEKCRLVEINPAGLRFVEADSFEQVEGVDVTAFMKPAYRQIYRDLTKRVFAGESSTMKYELIGLKGTTGWFEANCAPVKNKEGKIISMLSVTRDINAQRQISESINLQNEILNNIYEGVCLVRNDDATFIYTNPAFEKMFGYEKGELIDKHVSIVNAPSTKLPIETSKDILSVLREKGHWEGEVRSVKKDGTKFWTEARISSFKHHLYGDVWVTYQSDITSRKRVVEELAKARNLLSYYLDHVDGYAFIKDANQNYIFFNSKCEELFNVKRKLDGIVYNDFDFFEPKLAEQIQLNDLKVLETGEKVEAEEVGFARGKLNQGNANELMYFKVLKFPLRDANENIIGVCGFSYDITAQKKSEAELRISEERLKQASEHAGVIVWEIDPDGIYRFLSNNKALLKGHDINQIIGKMHFYDLLEPSSREATKNALFEKVKKLEPIEKFEMIDVAGDGQLIYFETSGFPMFDAEGNLIGYRGASQDITKRKLDELAIKLNEERLTRAELFSKTGSGEIHMLTQMVYGSKGAMAIYGSNEDSMSFDELRKLTLPQYRDTLDNSLQRLIEDHQTYDMEFEIRAVDTGEVKWIHSLGVYDKAKRIVFGTIQDITERKQNEELLRASKELYQAVFDKSPVGISLVDSVSGIVLEANQTFYNITQRDAAFFKHNHWMMMNHPEDVQLSLEYVKKMNSGEIESYSLSKRLLSPKGEIIWVNITVASLLREIDGRKTHITIMEDITKKREAEVARLEERERFYSLYESSMDGILISIPNQKILNANPAACNMFGMTEAEICSNEFTIFDINDEQQKAFLLDRNTNRKARAEVTLIRKNGEHFPAEVSSAYFYIGTKEERSSIIIRDLSGRRLAEQKLVESENRFRSLSENSLAGIFTHQNGVLTYLNPAAAEIFGYKVEELMGKSPTYIVHPVDIEMVTGFMLRRQRGELPFTHFEFRGVCKDGSTKWIETLSAEVSLGSGTSTIGNILDITDRKKADEKLMKLNRVYGVIIKINHAMVHIDSRKKLLDEVCAIAINEGKFFMAWIGMVNYETKKVEPVAMSGVAADYLKKIRKISIEETPEGMGPTGKAIREDRYVVSEDIEHDPSMNIWKQDAMNSGFKSSISIPIKQDGKVIGAFNLYSEIPQFFNEEEIELLLSVSEDIGYALDAIEKERQKSETLIQLTEAEKKLKHAQKIARIGSWNYKRGIGVEISHELAALLNIDPHPNFLSNEKVQGLLHPADIGKITNWSESHFAAQHPEGIEMRLMCGHEGYKPFIVEGEMLHDEQGSFIGLAGTMQDVSELRRVYNELQSINKLLEASQSVAMLGGWEIDIESKQVYWTAETYKLLDLDEADFKPTYDGALSFYSPDSKERLMEALQIAMEKGIGFDLELRVQTHKGRKIFVRIICDVILNEGKLHKLSGIIQDISDQKRKEKELMKSEEKYRLLFENAAETILVGQDGKIQLCNSMAITLTGYSIEELTSLPLTHFVHPDDRELVTQNYLHRIEGEYADKVYTYRILRKDNSIRWVEMNSISINWNDRNATLNFINDVTERKTAEDNLIKSLKETSDYKYAINESSIVSFTDSKGVITYANDNFCKIAQYTKEEMLGKTHHIVNSGYHPKSFFKAMWQCISSGKIWKGEIKNKAKDGSFYWVDSVIVPFLNEQGKPVQYIGIRADITERKNAEEELQLLNSKLGSLAAHVQDISEAERAAIAREIHDVLGQQMTALKFEIARLRKKNSNETQQFMDQINAMNLLVDDTIQSIRKISSELRPRILDDLGLEAAIEWFVSGFEKNTGIKCKIKSNLDGILFEKSVSIGFYRILQESLTNIARHAKATNVLIEASLEDEILSMKIKDNGIGVENIELTKTKSLGLLGMVERAKMIGGVLKIKGVKNRGTSVTLTAPISNQIKK